MTAFGQMLMSAVVTGSSKNTKFFDEGPVAPRVQIRVSPKVVKTKEQWIHCFVCGQDGHIDRNCQYKAKK